MPYSNFAVSSLGSYLDAQLADQWHSRLEVAHSENRDDSRDKLTHQSTPFNTYRDQVTWQNDLTLNDDNSVLLGGEWYEDRVHAATDFNEDSRWNRAVFAQHRFQGEHFDRTWRTPRQEPAIRRPDHLERQPDPAFERPQ